MAPANYVEATPRAVPNEPLFDETSGVALDGLSVRPASETPVQPASAQVLLYSSTSIFLFSAVESGAQNELCRTDHEKLGKITLLGIVRRAA
jgi:hypothetical protein